MKRRTFIKNSVIGTSGVLFVDSFLGCTDSVSMKKSIDEHFKNFQNPPDKYKLMVRWWWLGNRVNAKETVRELDVMKDAGIMGVEINPIALGQDPHGHKALEIYTDEWFDVLEVTLKAAKERGMVCDMIVASGWPFGGEHLKKDEQTQMVVVESFALKANEKYELNIKEVMDGVKHPLGERATYTSKDILSIRLYPCKSDFFTEGEELNDKVRNGVLVVDANEDKILKFVVKFTGFQDVIGGVPGAAGKVLNHYHKTAVTEYLDRVSSIITRRIGRMGNYIRSMFCDSLELYGANWCDDLSEEFHKRRGYSLIPYLPLIIKKWERSKEHIENRHVEYLVDPLQVVFPEEVKDKLARVELDYYITRLELFRERFIIPFTEWCHRNGMKSRVQAIGRDLHVFDSVKHVDIPEGETWIYKTLGKEYPDTGLVGRAHRMVNKYIASAAAFSGKKMVSCEENTNNYQWFMTSLEQVKISGDMSNISGINSSVLCGYNYSPLDIPFPGWIFWATFFSERNTWWPYFNLFAKYKARLSYLLQNSKALTGVAIFSPFNDLWLKYGLQRDPFPSKIYPEYLCNIWEAIHQNGGGCDYVSEFILNNAEYSKGRFSYNNIEFTTLLMPEFETLDVKTANNIAQFAKTGGQLVFIGKKPFKSHDVLNAKENDARVKSIIDDIVNNYPQSVTIYPPPEGNVSLWYKDLQEKLGIKPFVEFSRIDYHLSQASHTIDGTDFCLIANTSLEYSIETQAKFNIGKGLRPWVWNLETGEKSLMRAAPDGGVEIYLPRATSILVVFEDGSKGDIYEPGRIKSNAKKINGSWELECHQVDGKKFNVTVDKLGDLCENPETKGFGGTIFYKKNIHLDDNNYKYLDLA